MWKHPARSALAAALLVLVALMALACGGASDDLPAVSVATTETVAPAAVETATEEPQSTPTPVATPAEVTSSEAAAPQSGRWIDVDVSKFVVRLMDGASAVKVIGPVGVGEQVNTGAYASTQTGLFYVYTMDASLTYDPPYDTYISHWVGFDPAKDNGFHSFLKDVNGNIVDASTGRISNGCIRTGDPQAIYDFAEIGMPVYVHL